MNKDKVTIICATYNRPDTLKIAIESIRLQTVTNWKLLVIGDQCDDRTAEVIQSFDDDRLIYINGSIRFGEQAGPNSAGMALADTPYTAFINHDDIWLPDHLAYSLEQLQINNADFFIGRSAVSRFIGNQNGQLFPEINLFNPSNRKPIQLFSWDQNMVEPSSTYVFKTEKVRDIAFWNRSTDLHRYPIQDFVLRLWKKGLSFCFGERVTVWYMVIHYGELKAHYQASNVAHEYIRQTILTLDSADAMRTKMAALVQPKSILSKGLKPFIERLNQRIILNDLSAILYRLTGVDTFNLYSASLGRPKGKRMIRLYEKRTGEKMEDQISISDYITHIKSLTDTKT